MKKQMIFPLLSAFFCIFVSACRQDETRPQPQGTAMRFAVTHPEQATRATDTGFEAGDKMGLYVAQAGSVPEIGGQLVNNEALTLQSDGQWSAARTLYWDEGTYDAYAYYPHQTEISSITNLPFSVAPDQSTATEADGAMGGYEQSDLMWACSKGVVAGSEPIALQFKHIMSRLTVRLVKGEDFEGEMPTDAEVYIHNVVPQATIDLAAGVATRDMHAERKSIRARQVGETKFAAIIVPQRVPNRLPLIEVEMKGVSYLYESTFVFRQGMNHTVNLIISDTPDNIKIEIGGEIQNWN